MNTDAKTTKTAKTAKPTLTAEEKRAKRNAYAKAYYATHKEQRKASCKRCLEKKRAAKKAMHAICPAAQPEVGAAVQADA